MAYPAAVQRLIEAFRQLPGVGTRTAERHTFFLLRAGREVARELAGALAGLGEQLSACSRCHNLGETDPCAVCSDETRDRTRLLVVEQPPEVEAFEEAGWRGLYHVLGGHVSPLEGVDASDLTLAKLADRVAEGGLVEVVVATNPDYEGDATALHVLRRLEGTQTAVTRIARGVASGSAIEYSNAAMLSDALDGRGSMREGR